MLFPRGHSSVNMIRYDDMRNACTRMHVPSNPMSRNIIRTDTTLRLVGGVLTPAQVSIFIAVEVVDNAVVSPLGARV